jgi:hypothetical protein
VGGDGDVVEADDGDIVGDGAAGGAQCVQDADGHQVVLGENAVEFDAGIEDRLDGVSAAGAGEVAFDQQLVVEADAGLIQHGAEACSTVAGAAELGRARDHREVPAASGKQMMCRIRRTFCVACRHGGEAGVVAAVVDHHHGEAGVVQAPDVAQGVGRLDQ